MEYHGTLWLLGELVEKDLLSQKDAARALRAMLANKRWLALNIVIDTRMHTVPMRSLTPVLNGQHRKAPLFVPAADVAPDAGG